MISPEHQIARLQWVIGVLVTITLSAFGIIASHEMSQGRQLQEVESRVAKAEGINEERLRQLARIEDSITRVNDRLVEILRRTP